MIAQLSTGYIKTRPGRLFPRLISYFLFEGRPATTSGRWFNPITFASLRTAANTSQHPAAEHPVFITGTGRSGTTILGMILSMHPEIGFLNEPKALWAHVNGYDDLIGSYAAEEGKYLLQEADASPLQSKKVKSLYSAFLKLSGTHMVLDKYPEMIFRTEYLQTLFSQPKFIFLHRHPADTILSTAKWSAAHNSKNENWWGINQRKWKLLVKEIVPNDHLLAPLISTIENFQSETDRAAVEWIASMNKGLQVLQNNPVTAMKIGYEQLLENPVQTLSQICDFMNLSADKKMIDYGNQVLHKNPIKPIPEVHTSILPALTATAAAFGYRLFDGN